MLNGRVLAYLSLCLNTEKTNFCHIKSVDSVHLLHACCIPINTKLRISYSSFPKLSLWAHRNVFAVFEVFPLYSIFDWILDFFKNQHGLNFIPYTGLNSSNDNSRSLSLVWQIPLQISHIFTYRQTLYISK